MANQYEFIVVTDRKGKMPLLTVYNKAKQVKLQATVPKSWFWTPIYAEREGDFRPRYIALAYDEDRKPLANARLALFPFGRNAEHRDCQFEGVYAGFVNHTLMKALRSKLNAVQKEQESNYILRG